MFWKLFIQTVVKIEAIAVQQLQWCVILSWLKHPKLCSNGKMLSIYQCELKKKNRLPHGHLTLISFSLCTCSTFLVWFTLPVFRDTCILLSVSFFFFNNGCRLVWNVSLLPWSFIRAMTKCKFHMSPWWLRWSDFSLFEGGKMDCTAVI